MKLEVKPIYVYFNPSKDRIRIFKENKNKSGIYLWTNTISGKKYIGSSKNIQRRIRDYLNLIYLRGEIKKYNSLIYKALINNNYSNFKLEILEHCDEIILFEREQYYLNNLTPEYNTLKIAGSSLGFKHNAKTIEIIRSLKTGLVCSEETKIKLSLTSRCLEVKVTNLSTGQVEYFGSIKKAGDFIKIDPSFISRKLKRNNYYKNKNYHVIKIY